MKQSNSVDPLTGLPGTCSFDEKLQQLIEETNGTEGEFSLAALDIDQFEKVNMTFGRKAGDEVLRRTAAELKKLVGKKGGAFRGQADEFLVLLAETEKEEAFLQLEKLRQSLGQPFEAAGEGGKQQIVFSLSLGLAAFPADSGSKHELLRKAKDALFRSKAKGRNRISLAREEKMVTKTAHYTQGQLERLAKLSRARKVNEAVLLREALDDLLWKYDE